MLCNEDCVTQVKPMSCFGVEPRSPNNVGKLTQDHRLRPLAEFRSQTSRVIEDSETLVHRDRTRLSHDLFPSISARLFTTARAH